MLRKSLSLVPGGDACGGELMVDDRERARAAQSGDEGAFAHLVRRHSAGLHRAVSRIIFDDAEAWDVVQMAFFKAWQQIDRYDARWSFATWVYRIGTHLAIDLLRSRKSRERAHHAGMEHRLRVVGESDPSSRLAEQRDVEGVMGRVLHVLSPQQRGAFVLREIEGYSTAEVAEILGCSATTVRNHIFQARKNLREEIAQRFPEYLPGAKRGHHAV